MFAQPLHEASSADARLPAVWAAVLITFDISHNCWVDDMDAGGDVLYGERLILLECR